MLVFADGSQQGTLGGGCVEAEVRQRALRTLDEGQAAVHTFQLDNDYGWDDGLICGGRMTILSDPIQPQAAAYYQRFRQLVDDGQGCTEAVVLNAQAGLPVGARFLFDADGRWTAQLGSAAVTSELVEHLTPLQRRPRPSAQRGVAYLPILPRITLFIIGGGHVGHAVAKLAAEVDFDIWVLDDRAHYANRDRFPTAQRLLVGDIGQTLKALAGELTPSVYCLIVTRGHNHDEEALGHLATTNASYVGLIGSKRKIKLIYEDLRARGIPQEALARVYAPLGFHIGSQTVPEIAVSIVAELIACRNLGRTIPEARIRLTP
jgi:xanthine dehydrogenase accessory factor